MFFVYFFVPFPGRIERLKEDWAKDDNISASNIYCYEPSVTRKQTRNNLENNNKIY